MTPARFNFVRDAKKPLLKWLLESAATLIPRKVIFCEPEVSPVEKPYWRWKPRLANRWTLKLSTPLHDGELGYEEASHEIGYLMSAGSREVLKWVAPDQFVVRTDADNALARACVGVRRKDGSLPESGTGVVG